MDGIDGLRELARLGIKRLCMDRDQIRCMLQKPRQLLKGIRDHEMHVERYARDVRQPFDHGRAYRQIRDEVPVHDIDVDQIRAAHRDRLDIAFHVHEVGRENGR